MGAIVTVAVLEPAGGEEMPNTGQGAEKPEERLKFWEQVPPLDIACTVIVMAFVVFPSTVARIVYVPAVVHAPPYITAPPSLLVVPLQPTPTLFTCQQMDEFGAPPVIVYAGVCPTVCVAGLDNCGLYTVV